MHTRGDEKATNLVSLSNATCYYCSFPIIVPDPGHTKLRISREGLEAIERITTPIAAVAVSCRLISINMSSRNFSYD